MIDEQVISVAGKLVVRRLIDREHDVAPRLIDTIRRVLTKALVALAHERYALTTAHTRSNIDRKCLLS